MSGQTSFNVADQASLAAAIDAVDISGAASAVNTTYTIDMAPGAAIALTTDLPAINLATGDTLVINGDGATLRGNGNERGLFVYAGNVRIGNLRIAGTTATGGSGGTGLEGGGGGAGLGGGLFVGAAGIVATSNVTFANNAAVGGTGGIGGGYGLGGGGGMGGAGGSGPGKSGGGGIGQYAVGASNGAAGAGIVTGVPPFTSGIYSVASGGGGGGTHTGGGIGATSSSGGFGGGGSTYGNGGFGGGAGAFAKSGGFGGGGSGGVGPGLGGFGGGAGGDGGYIYRSGGYYNYYSYKTPGPAAGGGGLGAGGNVFVQQGGVLALGSGGLLNGAVAGGAAGGTGNGAGAGVAYGSAIFIQGNGVLYLAPGAGHTLDITGTVADMQGVGVQAVGSGTIAVSGGGMVVLQASNTYTGGTVIDGGTLQLGAAQSAGSGAIVFTSGTPGVLGIDSGAPTNTISGFAPGDTIVFAAAPASVSYSQANHQLTYAGGALNFDPTTAPAAVSYNAANGQLTVPCFAAGTCIDTTRGAVPVEHLRVGDRVALAGGGSAPIVWLGHRRLDCRRHPRPRDVLPVHVAAHAFGLDRPRRAVVLSPDHAVFVDGVLIPVRYLLNGATVRQCGAASVTYWHVELPRHGVLLADGLPAESYLDTGNRSAFAGGAAVMAHPDFARAAWTSGGCAPLVLSGPARDAVHRRLLVQAVALGHVLTEAPVLRVGADDAEPVLVAAAGATLTLPAGTRAVRLLSRSFVPAETATGSDDARRLGVALSLRLNGRPLASRAFAAGWHAPEDNAGWRWTDGAAVLALTPSVHPVRLTLRLLGKGARYWLAADQTTRSPAGMRAGSRQNVSAA